jgi:hypothetical protein
MKMCKLYICKIISFSIFLNIFLEILIVIMYFLKECNSQKKIFSFLIVFLSTISFHIYKFFVINHELGIIMIFFMWDIIKKIEKIIRRVSSDFIQ